MTKKLDIFGTLSSVLLLILAIGFIVALYFTKDDYTFSEDNKRKNKFIILFLICITLLNAYRLVIVIIVYVLFFLPFLIIYHLVSEFVYYVCCLRCWIDRRSYLKGKLRLRKNLNRNTAKFLAGSLDIFHFFFCFQNCMPLCVDHIQSCLDFLGLCKDVLLLAITMCLSWFIEKKRINGGNLAPILIFSSQCVPLVIILISNIIRFKRIRKVSPRVRDIFAGEEQGVDVRVFIEDSIDSGNCMYDEDCEKTEPEHRLKCHKKDHVFKLEKFHETNNIVIGFHQTSIENVKKIINGAIQASSEGWIGSGIYFATNFAATETKANHKGATLVAKIQLGRVEELRVTPFTRSSIQIADGYNSRYLHHTNGPKFDEFIIRDASQIKEYVVVMSKKEVKKYRDSLPKVW